MMVSALFTSDASHRPNGFSIVSLYVFDDDPLWVFNWVFVHDKSLEVLNPYTDLMFGTKGWGS